MTTESAVNRGTGGVDWRRAEFVLTLLGFLGFITVGIRITTIYDGLPAHPLIIHVPVVLIPASIFGALACVWRPTWFIRYGILLCLTSIAAMSSIFLAMQAGAALRGVLHLQGEAGHLIAFTAILILTFAATRISGEMGPTGLAIADRTLSARSTLVTLRVVLVVLALLAAFWVFRVGDLGAKAVWQGRIQAAQAQPGPGGY
jgi:hypothetical protein